MRIIGALVSVVIGALVSMFAGLALILLLDFMARSFGWVGVTSPPTGWLVIGVLAGGAIGLLEGLRRAGRPVTRKHIAMGAVGVAALLTIGSATWQQTDAASGPTVRVIAEGLNVRAEPDHMAEIVGSVARGQTLRVLGRSGSGDWYRIESIGSPRLTGWVGARYVNDR